jgi:membrane protease YdiL (CAAX protease family)
MGVLAFLGTDFVLSALGLPRVAGMDIGRPTLTAAAILVAGPVLVAPFGEELFFRVLWIGMLGQRVPRLLAAVAAIAAFSAYHYPYFGLGGAVFIAVWSIVPVTLFLWTKDITAPLLMHVLNNAFAYVLVPLIGD